MGRRFLLFLGIMLSLPAVRAQDDGGPPMPDATPAAPAELPLPKPLDLPAAEAGLPPVDRGLPPADGDLPPVDRPKPMPAGTPGRKSADRSRSKVKEQAPIGKPIVPPLDPVDGDAEPARPAGDRSLKRTEATADAAAQGSPSRPAAGASSDGDLAGIPADRLPVGKQSVAVTVDVQSPPNMNLYQPARVLIVVRNTGSADALQVRIRDELPDGLKFINSEPPPEPGGREGILSWSHPVLPAGADMVIALKVEPVKTGELEHGASVSFQTGSSAQTKVLQPKLTIEQTPSAPTVLKGQAVEFKIRVRNDGDGPARNVKITAKLGGGIRYGSGRRGDSEVVTDPIPVLGPGQSEELDPLVADAILEGPANCTVTARSPDVIIRGKDGEARSVVEVKVVEPKLEVAVAGPQRRPTDTVAPYEITLKNPGTAVARKVRVVVPVPPGVRLLAVPDGARYDQATRRLQWAFDTLEPGSTPRKLGFEVKVGEVGKFEIAAEALATGLKVDANRLVTEVFGMPDVDLVVSERQRVVDVGGKTIFLIRLRNYGTKDATNLLLTATVSGNLKVTGSFDVPAGLEFQRGAEGQVVLQDSSGAGLKRLGPGREIVMGLEVEVTGPKPQVAKCHVQVKHDELTDGFEDEAAVKVLPPSSRAGVPAR